MCVRGALFRDAPGRDGARYRAPERDPAVQGILPEPSVPAAAQLIRFDVLVMRTSRNGFDERQRCPCHFPQQVIGLGLVAAGLSVMVRLASSRRRRGCS